MKDGKVYEEGEKVIDLLPKCETFFEITKTDICRLGAFVNCYLYDENGFEVASCQLDMCAEIEKLVKSDKNVEFFEDEHNYKISAGGNTYTFSKHLGEITSLIKNEDEMLCDNIRLTVMRAPIDNERRIRDQFYKEYLKWEAEGFDRIYNKCYEVKRDGNKLVVSGSLSAVGRLPFLRYSAGYSFYEDGSCKIELSGDVREDVIWLPRLGFEIKTPSKYNKFSYFGRGKEENYIDMHYHTKKGFYESDAESEYVNYIYPQEHGNHTGAKELKMENGIFFSADKEFEFNVSRYSALSLMKAEHIDELEKDENVIIRIDYKNSGVGSASCGPQLLEKYRLCEKRIDGFEFFIS